MIDVTLAAIVAVVTMLATHTAADADLWGHLRFGADVIAGGRLPAHDPYSFTSDITWINHEWLSEAIFAAVYLRAGALGLNLLKLSAVALVAAFVWRWLRRAAATDFSAIVATSLVVLTITTRTGPIRPQLFSVGCFAVLLAALDAIESGTRGAIAILPVLFAVWANTHGGWIVGLGVSIAWAVWTRRPLVAIAAAAGSLVNPYGIGLWRFIYSTVGLSRPEIVDWMPLYRLPPRIVALECLVPAIALAAIARSQRLPRPERLAVVALLGIAAARVSRIDAFLHIAIAWSCAPAIAECINSIDARLRRSARVTQPRRAHAAAAAAVAVVALAYSARHIGRISVEGDWAPDADALRYLKTHAAHARLVTWFDWGEYAIWHLSPDGILVSMDGRRETVYSDRVLHDHFAFYRNETDAAWRYPDRIGADRVWLPKKLPIVAPLRAHGWRAEFETASSIVLARDAAADTIAAAVIPSRDRIDFPGP